MEIHQVHDELEREEEHERTPQLRLPEGTPVRTWMAVFGSSAVFHLLLLVLLGLLITGEPETKKSEHVTVEIREQEENDDEQAKREITKREFDTVVEDQRKRRKPDVELEQVALFEREPEWLYGDFHKIPYITNENVQIDRTIALGRGSGGHPTGSRESGEAFRSGGKRKSKPDAVSEALKWLARHQSDDGRWDADGYDQQCPEENKCEVFIDENRFDVGGTGLSLLAFLGAGYTQQSDTELEGISTGEVVRKGLYWLKKNQRENGAFDTTGKQMYNHALATLAFAEAHRLTGAPRLKDVAQKGVNFLEEAQNADEGKLFGWGYEASSGNSETFVTVWCATALKSAELAGLDTSGASMEGALRWVETVTNQRGVTGNTGKINSRGKAHKQRAMTPAGMLVRTMVHEHLDDARVRHLKLGADFVVNRLPEWREGDENLNFYYWYFGTLALNEFAGPGTPFEDMGYWQKWKEQVATAVQSGQQSDRDGHEAGSWDPLFRRRKHGGRVRTTAILAMTLELLYRYENALLNDQVVR